MFTRKLLAMAVATIAFAPSALAETLMVTVNQSSTLKLNAPATSVVLGDASIVDVEVLDSTTLLVTGKAFGSTNLMVLGRGGRKVYSNMLAVTDNLDNKLTITRGNDNYTYSCFDRCRSAPVAGDAGKQVAAANSGVR